VGSEGHGAASVSHQNLMHGLVESERCSAARAFRRGRVLADHGLAARASALRGSPPLKLSGTLSFRLRELLPVAGVADSSASTSSWTVHRGSIGSLSAGGLVQTHHLPKPWASAGGEGSHGDEGNGYRGRDGNKWKRPKAWIDRRAVALGTHWGSSTDRKATMRPDRTRELPEVAPRLGAAPLVPRARTWLGARRFPQVAREAYVDGRDPLEPVRFNAAAATVGSRPLKWRPTLIGRNAVRRGLEKHHIDPGNSPGLRATRRQAPASAEKPTNLGLGQAICVVEHVFMRLLAWLRQKYSKIFANKYLPAINNHGI